MKYFFLIGTHHQLFQVDAAINHFNIPFNDVVLLVQDLNSDNDLYNRIVNLNQYKEIHNFPNWTFKDIIRSNKANYFIDYCRKLKARKEKITFFASHYSDDSTFLFLSIIKPLKFYLMDEGTASYNVLQRRSSYDFKFKLKLILKSLLYKTNLKEESEIIYFTKFNFIPGNKDKKEVYEIPKIDNKVETFLNQFGFLGTSVVEVDVMSIEDYLFFLKEIASQNKEKELLYYKHRKEEDPKLLEITRLGFKIVELDIPFEKHYGLQENLPSVLGSFFTTSVLINISENFKNIPVLNIYEFPIEKLSRQRKVFINILKYLKDNSDLNFIYLQN